MSEDLIELILKAHKKSFQTAFETAVRTGTSLVFTRNGKVVKVKPPFRYVMVPIKPKKKRGPRSKK